MIATKSPAPNARLALVSDEDPVANDTATDAWSPLSLARWFCGAESVPRRPTSTGTHPVAPIARTEPESD